MSRYNQKNAAKDTGSSRKDTSRAWHNARNDAAGSGSLHERNVGKVSDSESGSILYNIISSIFGRK